MSHMRPLGRCWGNVARSRPRTSGGWRPS